MKSLENRTVFLLSALFVLSILLAQPINLQAQTITYTLDADFDQGVLVGVEHDTVPDQLQLSENLVTLPFIWVANSGESTVSKIDTETGVELGRYRTGPGEGFTENPSRTTVDLNGDLWVGNRNSNTAVKIALIPTDLNNDGIINTSTGPGDVKPWLEDEAVLMRIPVDSGPRALAVDASNNVWIGGTGRNMGYYNGETGINIKNINVGQTCYGALVDGDGTLWISTDGDCKLVRIDDPSGGHSITVISTTWNYWVYGIGIDSDGFIYSSGWTNNRLRKLNPTDNSWVWDVASGGSGGRGVAVGFDGDIWVAHSMSNAVMRYDAATGAAKATVPVGDHPTGVAVDTFGMIWVTNYNSSSVNRINPATNAVDFTQGGHPYPYNYSDMTGIIARTITTKTGTWSAIFDSGLSDTPWGTISWNSSTPAGTSVTVKARSSADGITWSAWETAGNGVLLSVTPDGQYIEVETTLQIASGDESPILYDLTIQSANQSPDCSNAYADPGALWPPNHQMVPISILGVTDPDGDPVTIEITGITSDEPTASDKGSGGAKYSPDAEGVGTHTAIVRAERSGNGSGKGNGHGNDVNNGRVYVISFTASDGQGGECSCSVTVCVPHDQGAGSECVDDGQLYDATAIN